LILNLSLSFEFEFEFEFLSLNLINLIMKAFILSLFLLLPLLSEAQSASIRKFYRNHKSDVAVHNVYIPGFVVKTASLFFKDKVQRRLLRKLGGVRILMSEDHGIAQEEYQNLIHNVRNDRFDDFIQVRDKGESFNVMVRETDSVVRGVLVTMREDNGFVLVGAKSNISTEELMKLVELMKD
jgi:hypothetical protein